MSELLEQSEKYIPADVRLISGCKDAQTSADVSDVASFQLPDPAGRAVCVKSWLLENFAWRLKLRFSYIPCISPFCVVGRSMHLCHAASSVRGSHGYSRRFDVRRSRSQDSR